jgi:hypothetical protein
MTISIEILNRDDLNILKNIDPDVFSANRPCNVLLRSNKYLAKKNMITFTVAADSSISPEQICEEIFDVDRWSSFKGYGVLPGIAKVTMKSPANSIVETQRNSAILKYWKILDYENE